MAMPAIRRTSSRPDAKSAQALVKKAKNQGPTLARIHALWGIGQILELSGDYGEPRKEIAGLIKRLSQDTDPEVRAQVMKFSAEHRWRIRETALTLMQDPNSRVRYFATLALGACGEPEDLKHVSDLLVANNNADPALRHAGIIALNKIIWNHWSRNALVGFHVKTIEPFPETIFQQLGPAGTRPSEAGILRGAAANDSPG